MKKSTYVIIAIVVILIGVGIYFMTRSSPKTVSTVTETPATTTVTTTTTTETQQTQDNATSTVIGKSVEGRDITAYHFGTGNTELTFVGGIHGGYEWNTSLVAYQLMDYLAQNPNIIPANEKITVIPVLNPDGLASVVGTDGRFTAAQVSTSQTTLVAGRFNANNVDLNRNFDCDWQASGTWQNKTVSGGSGAFSEPETQAMKNYVEANKPAAVVVYFSAAGGVYASDCHGPVLPETDALTKAYASASGYSANESYDFYALTGDIANWLAKINVPAISVVLTNHTDTEWTKNQAGVNAILKYYAK